MEENYSKQFQRRFFTTFLPALRVMPSAALAKCGAPYPFPFVVAAPYTRGKKMHRHHDSVRCGLGLSEAIAKLA